MIVFLWACAWSAVISAVLAALNLITYWRSRGQHWSERARARMPARVCGSLINPWYTPLAVTLASAAFVSKTSWPYGLTGGLLGTLLGDYVLARSLHPSMTFLRWTHLAAAGLVLHLARYGILVAAIVVMPRQFGRETILVAGAYLATHFALQLGGGSFLLRRFGLLVKARPRLIELVKESCAQCGVFPRATWELVSLEANACAFVTTRELAFSQPLLDALSDAEIKAVAAHELAHLAEGRPILLSRIVGSLTLAPVMFLIPLGSQFGMGGVVMCGLTVVVTYLLNRKLTLKMEKRADAATIAATQDGATYARALEHLHRINEVVAVQQDSTARTHPNLYDRMIAAGVTPDFPRPLPPSSWNWSVFALWVAIMISAMALFRP